MFLGDKQSHYGWDGGDNSCNAHIVAWPVKADGYTEWQNQARSNDTDTSRMSVCERPKAAFTGAEGRAKSRHWAKAGRTRGTPPVGTGRRGRGRHPVYSRPTPVEVLKC